MYYLRNRKVIFQKINGDENKSSEATGGGKAEPQLDELLVTLNKMTQIMEMTTKRVNTASNIPMDTFSGHPSDDARRWLEKFEAWIAFNGWKDNVDKIVSAMQLKLEGNALFVRSCTENKMCLTMAGNSLGSIQGQRQ